jgi:hypothetical protein
MTASWWNRLFGSTSRAAVRRRRPPIARPRVEELEARVQPALFLFSTGVPDGRAATISEPPNAHNSQVEFESADDFVLSTETVINRASFTGLLTGGATLKDVNDVFLTSYRVFNNDSDLNRTPQVPTRINSPADNEIENFDSAVGELRFNAQLLNSTFTAQNSVSSADKISFHQAPNGGNGQATGEEVQFNVTFNHLLDLPAGHYFFVPKIGLSAKAPAGADFLWLSAPRPITPPGTPFPAGATDLQSWMRFDPGNGTGLAPDWLRIGTDIVGGATFNGSFTLSGQTVPPHMRTLSQSSAVAGSPDLTLTINGSDFTSQSVVQVNGNQALTTTFVSSSELQAIIPAALLAHPERLTLTVNDPAGGLSNNKQFTVTKSIPTITASADQGRIFQEITLNGQVSDTAVQDHRLRINWGDGTVQTIDLGVQSSSPFSISHTFAPSRHVHHDTITVTALDIDGTASTPLRFDVIV